MIQWLLVHFFTSDIPDRIRIINGHHQRFNGNEIRANASNTALRFAEGSAMFQECCRSIWRFMFPTGKWEWTVLKVTCKRNSQK